MSVQRITIDVRKTLLMESALDHVAPAHGKCWSCGLYSGHKPECKVKIQNAKRYL